MNILYTGAFGGIARNTIKKLKEYDVHIWVGVHTEKQLELISKKYQNDTHIICLKLDITDEMDLCKVKELDIDVLICNAAIGMGGSVMEIPIDYMRENFEVNVFSNFKLIQWVLSNMIKKGRGRIILMSSLAGHIAIPFLGSYCATKASIIKLAEALRLELKLLPALIDVILIEPGLYATGFNRVMLDNKYSFMKEKTYFENEIDFIHKYENIFIRYGERKNIDTISNKIIEAIIKENPKKVYKAPFIQALFTKLYMAIKE